PYIIAKYSYETASTFNNFYEACPVLTEKDTDRRLTRLALVHATAVVLKDAFSLLGIEMPERL
ncbi:MAG: arginine--tRNA ligase, partial [Thermoplasmata archaeon]